MRPLDGYNGAQTMCGIAAVLLADSSGDGILEEEEFVQFNLETGKELNDYDFAQQCRAWTFFARGRG